MSGSPYTHATPMRRILSPGLFAALAVYILLRALLLHTAFDETALVHYELYPMGTIPMLLSGAGEIPLHFHYDNAAGQLFTGVVAWPLYAVFGDSYLVLKLVPVLLGVMGLVFLHLFLRENFSERAATIGSLLFALGPVPTMMKYSMLAAGNHFEHIPFAILTLWCFYRLHREHGGSDRKWLFITGAAMGFQLFILLGAAIPILLLCCVHLGLRGVRDALKDLGALIPGALLGMLPLLAVNWASRGRGGGFLGAKFEESGAGFLGRAWEFAVERMGRAATFDDSFGVPAGVAAAIFIGASAVAWFAAAAASSGGLRALIGGIFSGAEGPDAFSRARLVPLVLYLPAIVVVYGMSNFELRDLDPPLQAEGYRYYLPHFLFITVLIAIIADRWMGAEGLRRIAGRVLLGASFCAASLNLSYIDWSFEGAGKGTRYAGYNYVQTARTLFTPLNGLVTGEWPGKWDPDREKIVAVIEGFDAPWRHQLYIGAGFCEGLLQHKRNSGESARGVAFLDTRVFLPAYPAAARSFVARGAGVAVRWTQVRSGKTLAAWITQQTPRADPLIADVIAGSAIGQDFPHVASEFGVIFGQGRQAVEDLDPQRAAQLARGLGQLAGVVLARGIPSEVAALEAHYHQVRAEHRNALLRGVGEQLAIAGVAPTIPLTARRLQAPEGESALKLSFERSVQKVWGDEAEGVLTAAAQDH